MMRHDLPAGRWRKSSHSEGAANTCVETQMTPDGLVALGDSKDRARGALVFGTDSWTAFVTAVRLGSWSA